MFVAVKGRPRVPRQVEREFWRLVSKGSSTESAAISVGVSFTVGLRWFRDGGGMTTVDLSEPTGRYLSMTEREDIAVWWGAGVGVRQIARRLGRAPSTISPEQIARRLVVDFPSDEPMRICHETIYQALYVQGRGGLRRELTACLRTGRALRKPQRRADQRQERIKGKVMISERPAEVGDRAVPGHWEGDLIIGKDSGSAIGTLVERTTRFTMLLHLPADHGALTVREAIEATITTLPAALRRTLTWDQGIELAQHQQLTFDTDLAVYFCDPHSPWQRGTNENTNGLLRQYFPKGTNLSVHGPQDLERVAAGLNGRPRKTLDWKTPAEALAALLSAAA